MEIKNFNMGKHFIHQYKKNGKMITFIRKLCASCKEEYYQELNNEDVHKCEVPLTKDEIYDMNCDREYEKNR